LILAYIVPSGLGSNIDRVRYIALPLALIVATLRHWRPLWIVVPAIALGAIWNLTPIVDSFSQSTIGDPEVTRSYWQPAIGYLHKNLSPSYRVEAVDTVEHWPAAYLPEAGIPIVRGWYRQGDFPTNELLYDKSLNATTYDAWLRELGVRYVVISDATPDYSSRLEARLIRSGESGLLPVLHTQHVDVYEVPNASPIVTGPGKASIDWLYPNRVVFEVTKPGMYHVAVRWSPYWKTAQGCVAKGSDGMVRTYVPHAGMVDMQFDLTVSRGLETIAGVKPDGSCG
jgi:hypothetical protein